MRTTKTVFISVLPEELKVAGHPVQATNRSMSGAVREGLKRQALEQYWHDIQAMVRPKAEALGLAEGDVNRLIEEYRGEKHAQETLEEKPNNTGVDPKEAEVDTMCTLSTQYGNG